MKINAIANPKTAKDDHAKKTASDNEIIEKNYKGQKDSDFRTEERMGDNTERQRMNHENREINKRRHNHFENYKAVTYETVVINDEDSFEVRPTSEKIANNDQNELDLEKTSVSPYDELNHQSYKESNKELEIGTTKSISENLNIESGYQKYDGGKYQNQNHMNNQWSSLIDVKRKSSDDEKLGSFKANNVDDEKNQDIYEKHTNTIDEQEDFVNIFTIPKNDRKKLESVDKQIQEVSNIEDSKKEEVSLVF